VLPDGPRRVDSNDDGTVVEIEQVGYVEPAAGPRLGERGAERAPEGGGIRVPGVARQPGRPQPGAIAQPGLQHDALARSGHADDDCQRQLCDRVEHRTRMRMRDVPARERRHQELRGGQRPYAALPEFVLRPEHGTTVLYGEFVDQASHAAGLQLTGAVAAGILLLVVPVWWLSFLIIGVLLAA